jgi:hypothetical protein
MKNAFVMLFVLCIVHQSTAQVLTQTVKGKIIDEDSKAPLIGVNVKLSNETTFYGASTDLDGNFKINDVPVGRYLMEVSYIGYAFKSIPNLDVDAGKEKVMSITLTETFQSLGEITVTAEKEKHKAQNEMALVSARSFSVEETKRYAGSANDPARMASSFAGVSSRSASSLNDIIIRGNSPRGLLWRINGIEMPNPNHFATEGAGGGGISVINSNVLSNSDFYTGAFPAEYGNAFSGIFDINFRQGNNEKYEYAIKGGVLGSDISVEGPISRNVGSSFLMNYRYSTLGILNKIGVFDDEEGIIFQDFTYNVHLPTKKAGTFSVFGIVSASGAEFESEFRDTDTIFNSDGSITLWDTIVFDDEKETYQMGAMGVTHTYFLDDKTFLKSYLSADQSGFITRYRSLDDVTNKTFLSEEGAITNSTLRASVNINRKINSRNTVRAGLIFSELFYDMSLKETDTAHVLTTRLDQSGQTTFSQAYVSWKFKMTEKLTATFGTHVSRFGLNKELLIEPRMAMLWQFTPLQSLSLGFGVHSRREALSAYFGQQEGDAGQVITPNIDLPQTKARHYVLGYDFMIRENLHFKTEVYYQDLYDVGVEAEVKGDYSLLNQDNSFTTIPLKGTGTGSNYGTELTLENFFSNSYYFLLAVSLYESSYKGSNRVEHDTRYNGNHLTNLAIGKEVQIGSELKRRKLIFNTRATVAGNNRYTSIDLQRSIAEDHTVFVEGKRFDQRMDTYSRIDFSISLIRQKKKSTREWKLDILNMLNTKNADGVYYDRFKREIIKESDGTLIPVLSYQVKF